MQSFDYLIQLGMVTHWVTNSVFLKNVATGMLSKWFFISVQAVRSMVKVCRHIYAQYKPHNTLKQLANCRIYLDRMNTGMNIVVADRAANRSGRVRRSRVMHMSEKSNDHRNKANVRMNLP